MIYFELLLIGISLSLDAFSLSIAISTSKKIKNSIVTYSFIVGIFHFFMPLMGYNLKNIIDKIYKIPTKPLFLIVIIFIIIGIIIDDDNKLSNKILNPFIFAFTVSIDSLTIGITLNKIIVLKACLIFLSISTIMTFIGFKLGNKINNLFKNKSKIISISILIIVLIYNLLS